MNCKGCGRFFAQNSPRQQYCTLRCRRKHYAKLAKEADIKEQVKLERNQTDQEIGDIVRNDPGAYAKKQAEELRKRMWME